VQGMKLLRELNSALIAIAAICAIVSMAIIAVVIPYEVFCRYVLNNMSTWSTELTQYSLVWASMMGGAAGLKKGYQVGITSLIESVPPFPAKLVKGAGLIASLVFLAFMTVYGVNQTVMNMGQVSSSMGIRMSIPYACLPLGFFIMFCVTIEQILELIGLSADGGK
jgi:TRAP-type C4-dicarboxylate transport system permease small subunit